LAPAEQYKLGRDSQPRPGVPKGTLTEHVLKPGRFYPGTPHDYSVYVPSQYRAEKPAPLMIYLDGSGATGDKQRVPVVFDNLIARGELPPLIGIFVNPGVLPALSDQVQSRYERVFEYDSIGDRFARFLIEELIPEVAKSYNLSPDPNDHGISGVSTGAVGAFIAAWNRPDQFRRVMTFIGTFVSMKGADTLPGLIRKTEPKPIRIFMQAGRNDHIAPNQPYGTFYAGSWPINNRVMAEALEFSGYDVKLVIGSEGHNMKHGAAIMPEALRWLWRDYPKPIEVHAPAAMGRPDWDPRGKVFSIVSPDKPWRRAGEAYKSAAGLTADKDGAVYFSDPSANRIYRSAADGPAAVFKENSGGATALRFAPDGRLYASQPGHQRIVSYGAAGEEKAVARNVAASDLAITAKNEIYFIEGRHVGLIDAKRNKRIVYDGGEIALPSALSLSPDQAMLIVGDGQTRFSWSFQIAADGSLQNGEPFFRVEMPETVHHSGVRSIAFDTTGGAYFASEAGIQVCEQSGRCAQILSKPEPGEVTSLAFGGKDLNWLYATEGGRLFRREVKTRGVAPWAPVKAPKPLL
jgi:sugar lactone lactonase YvrE